MNRSSALAKKPVIKQPAANPPRPRKQLLDERPPSEIAAEKIAAMAARPDAVVVYETEKGIDAKGWDIICPEYKIFDAALKGGYGWWDLTEGAGRHLLPKPKPYKIVKITSAELKIIRAREAEEDAAAAAAANAVKEAEFEGYRAATRAAECLAKERTAMSAEDARAAERLAKERTAMSAEDARASDIRLAEWRAAQAAKVAEDERLRFISIGVEVLFEEIKALPEHKWTQAYLVDYIADQVWSCPKDTQDLIIEQICTRIEAKHMLFYTPVCSPELAPRPAPAAPPPPFELAAAAPLPVQMPVQLQTPPEDPIEFVKQPPFILFGTLYTPVAFLNGLRMYMPANMLDALLYVTMRPPPATVVCGADCRECYPPSPLQICGADCRECYPPPPCTPPSELPTLLPTPTSHPLPVIQARIVPQPPKLPSIEMMKGIKIRKLRMPSKSRIQRLLSGAK